MIDWKNRNVILLSVSAVLFVLGFWLNDPFGMFESSYSNAKPLVAAFEGADVEKIIVNEGGAQKRAFVRTSSGWTLTGDDAGTTYKANFTRLNQGLDKIKDAKRYRVVTSSEDKFKDYEVTNDDFTIELTIKGGSKAKLYLGKAGENYNSTLVRVDGEDDVYSVKGSLRNDWNQDADYFRDKKVFRFAQANVAAYQIKGPQNYEVKQTDLGGWQVKIKKQEFKGLKTKIENILKSMAELEGTKFYRKKKAPRPYARIDVTLSSNKKDTLEVYGPTKNNEFIIRSSYAPDYMTIPKHRIETIIAKPATLEDKTAAKGSATPGLPGSPGAPK